ncbi:hypothetical protein EIP91_001190 [Steccherinum ochraceum]|uniref:Opioid growth factor receptor (OGFr) conserved domain-containing protein n=1 Tax=Steccherinum ochraceum TaxID=92696 RepID=A0A4R0RUM5_9APHY|nr:hypothetical protein EIP91_001190 [Steccherinum ochraceum]
MSKRINADIQRFLDDDYADPSERDHVHSGGSANLQFYSNTRRCRPDNLLIDDIHQQWKGNHSELEWNHSYIQWLFPIQESGGMNPAAQSLQLHEREAMKSNQTIIGRVLESYRIMLDFYGMELDSTLDEEEAQIPIGLLKRTSDEEVNAERYKHLNRSFHNYLRITRILKHLSEMGLEHLNAGFLLHVLNEQSQFGQLRSSRLVGSMDDFWANCIRNDEEREWVGKLIRKVRDDEFSFTRDLYEDAMKRRKDTGSFREASSS